MSSPILDHNQRLQALDIESSYCVQAPAGSGKTELLTQRILKLLAVCEQPEQVLAFTFTRKATAEMRNRLLQSLQKAASLSDDEIEELPAHSKLTFQLSRRVLDKNEQCGWHLLENTQRLRITTIDAFNAYLTSQLPIVSAFGAQPEITTEMDAIFDEAVQLVINDLDSNKEISEHLKVLLTHQNNNLRQVKKLLCLLLNKRDQWLSHIVNLKHSPELLKNQLNNNLQELIDEALQHTHYLLTPFATQISSLMNFAADYLNNNDKPYLNSLGFTEDAPFPSAEFEQLPKWQAMADFFTTQSDQFRKTVNVKNGFPAASSAKDSTEKALYQEQKSHFMELLTLLGEDTDILNNFIHLKQLPTDHYNEKHWSVLSALSNILLSLVSNLNLIFQRQSKADYSLVSSAALAALGDDDDVSDLALRLDYQIKHILIDEFQDTSLLQTRLLEKLTQGWETDDGRTLFIVGDGMQSCYRFRNANVGLFLSARDNGIGQVHLNSLQLQVNFRSDCAVVNWVNSVFSGAFPQTDDISRGAVTYSPSEALDNNSSQNNTGVETLIWVNDKENEVDASEAKIIEAQSIAEKCQAIKTDSPESSVAILVRTRSHLNDIIPVLRQNNLSYNASGIDSLMAYSEINDLLSLFKGLSNLADNTALLALLRSPFIGLLLDDIYLISQYAQQHECSLWQALSVHGDITTLSDDGFKRLQRIMPLLIQSRQCRQTAPIRIWLEETWIVLGGPATLHSETDLGVINSFFDALDEFSINNDILDIHGFEEKLSGIYVSAKHKVGVNLQIMTIHNAKGLEFDYVLIPGLHRQTRADDNELILWQEHLNYAGEDQLLVGLLSETGQEQDSVYSFLRYEDQMRNAMESTRLLYIAVTRAAKKAYLYGLVTKNKGKEDFNPPIKSSLLFSIWPQLIANNKYINVQFKTLFPTQDSTLLETPEVIVLNRITQQWQHPLNEQLTLREQENNDDINSPLINLTDIEQPHHHLVQKKRGDLIHYCLKLMVEQTLDLSDSSLLTDLTTYWKSQLTPICRNEVDLNVNLGFIKNNLQACLTHPKAAWIFNHRHEQSQCELSLSDYRKYYRREFIVDRTFVDTDGTRWIIDYKSSQPNEQQPLEQFLQQQIDAYQPQLSQYAELFKEMEDRPIKTALFLTAIPHWLEISI